MEKVVKLSDEQLSRLIDTYREEREEIADAIEQLKAQLKSIDDLIDSFRHAQASGEAPAAEVAPAEEKVAATRKPRGKKSVATKAPTKNRTRSKGPSYADRILEAIQSQNQTLSAAQISELLLADEEDRDSVDVAKFKQNVHSNLNNLMRRGDVARVEGSQPFVYGTPAMVSSEMAAAEQAE